MIILGVDPGYDRCGWAVIESIGNRFQPLAFDCLQTTKQDGKWLRLDRIRQHFVTLLEQYPVAAVAVESLFFSRNVSTALPVSEVRGLIFGVALAKQIPIFEYPPASVKLAVTGYGRAEKDQVTKMAVRLLGLEKIPKIDDTGDALAVALTHGLQAGSRLANL